MLIQDKMRRITQSFLALLLVGSLLFLAMFLVSSDMSNQSLGIPKPVVKRLDTSQETAVQDVISNIRARVKTLEAECQRLKLNGSEFQSIEKSKLDHIVVDDKYKTMYCYVPKVACTNLKRVFLLLTGQMNVTDPLQLKSADVHSKYDSYLTYLNTYKSSEILYRLKNYKKVMFVREPFERVLSAFRNKFVQRGNEYFKQRFGRKIVRLYRENPDEQSLAQGDDVEFPEFVEYLIDPKTRRTGYNEHWKPVFDLCHPCHVHYNYIGKYETIDEDVNGLLKLLQVEDFIQFPDRSDMYKTLKTEELLLKFYKTIDPELIWELSQIFHQDYHLFGYEFPKSIKTMLQNY